MRRLATVLICTLLICTLGLLVACAAVEEPAQVGPAPTPAPDVCPTVLEEHYLDTITFAEIILAHSNNNIEWLLALTDEQLLSLGAEWFDRLAWNYANVYALNVTLLKVTEAPTERTVPVQERLTAIGVVVESAYMPLGENLTEPDAESIEEFFATLKDSATVFAASLSTALEDIAAIDETVEAMCDEPATASATPVPTQPTPSPARPVRDGLTLATAAYADGMATAPNGVTMRIVAVVPDATEIILNHDKIFNAPPPEGFRYVMVTVDVGNTSSQSLEFEADQFFLISDTRTRYDMPPILGIPNSIRGGSLVSGSTEVFPGGVARKNVAYLVPNNETGYALMFDAERREEDDRAFILLPE